MPPRPRRRGLKWPLQGRHDSFSNCAKNALERLVERILERLGERKERILEHSNNPFALLRQFKAYSSPIRTL